MRAVLEGIRVLDLTLFQAGPYCGVLLSDMGAEVIKIENVNPGDPGRSLGTQIMDVTSYFLCLNRGKKGFAINLQDEKGKEIFLKLAATADVVIQNYRPGVMARLGIDHQSLLKVNPRIIMGSCYGFGEDGPRSQWPGIDLVMQGMSGNMFNPVDPESQPQAMPSLAIADMTGGMYLFQGVLGALLARERFGIAQEVVVSLLDGQISLNVTAISDYLLRGPQPPQKGRRTVPYQPFETKDGYIIVAVVHDIFWPKFCTALEIEHLKDDPRFLANRDRVSNQVMLLPMLEERFRQKTSAEWLDILRNADVVCGPVYHVPELLEDPQLKHNQMIISTEHPDLGTVYSTASPWKFKATPAVNQGPAPLHGQHTAEVLTNLGYNEEEIRDFNEARVIKVHGM